MFGIFGKRKAVVNQIPQILYFTSNFHAFDYACEWLRNEVRERQTLVALVLDPADEGEVLSTQLSDMNRIDNKYRFFLVRVASDDGGFRCIGSSDNKKATITPGDFVLWVPVVNDPTLGIVTDDPRSSWIGRIIAKLSPAYSIKRNSFATLESFLEA